MKKTKLTDEGREDLAGFLLILKQDDIHRFIGWISNAITTAPKKTATELAVEFREFCARRILEQSGLPVEAAELITERGTAKKKELTFADRQAIRRLKIA